MLGLCLNIRILRAFGFPPSEIPSVWSFPEYTNTAGIWCFPSEIPSVWSIPEYTNTAGIWYSPLEYKVFGFCLNIRILRVFGAPRKYQLFGFLLEYTKTAGIWYFPYARKPVESITTGL